MVNFFSTKYMANDEFSEPPRRADSKTPIFIFRPNLGPHLFQGLGVSFGKIWGPSIEPFGGGGGGRGLYRPTPRS